MLNSAQIRSARGCLNISQLELAKETGIHLNTIHRIEGDDALLARASMATVKKIKEFFEHKGIKFLSPPEKDGSGAGLRYFPPDE